MNKRGAIGAALLVVVAAGVAAGVASTQTTGGKFSILTGATPANEINVPVKVSELPLPPTVPTDGVCTSAAGCVSGVWGTQVSPGFFWDVHYVLLGVTYAGAPSTGPSSIYQGSQVLVENVDGTKFPGGEAWKCLTCGVAGADEQGVITSDFNYPPPHALPGDKQVLVGNGILECGTGGVTYVVTDPRCTATDTRIYPIYWGNQPLGGPPNKAITNGREWRLSPDGVHLAWNDLDFSNGNYDEFAFVGRLSFDPTAGRYNLIDVTMLMNTSPAYQPYEVEAGNKLVYNPTAMIGEYRGWSSNGQDVLGIQSYESDSIDAFETSLATGKSTALTDHAEYTDPMFMSPNGKWTVNEEVAGSGRVDFAAAAEGIPPLTDQLPLTGYVSGIRNAGMRRYFLPYLVDPASGQREQINAGGDPDWNAAADPVWLADSSAVVWAENIACGANPQPHQCAQSTEPGGRNSRVMMARFPTLPSTLAKAPAPISDTVSWGIPFTVGKTPFPTRPHLPAGSYTLDGTVRGSAKVTVAVDSSNARVMSISVSYDNFADNRDDILNGTESVARSASSAPAMGCATADSFFSCATMHEDLRLSGQQVGTKQTSPDGFTMSPNVFTDDFIVTGTLTTTVIGKTYTQPAYRK